MTNGWKVGTYAIIVPSVIAGLAVLALTRHPMMAYTAMLTAWLFGLVIVAVVHDLRSRREQGRG